MIKSPPQSRWASVRAAYGGGDKDVAAVARRLQSLGDAARAAMRHAQQELAYSPTCLLTHLLLLLACSQLKWLLTRLLYLCAAGATAALPGVH